MEFIQGTLFGKMYPEHFPVTKEKISEPCLTSLLESAKRTPLCLRFQKQDGHMQTVTPVTDGALRTEFLMLNTGESPKDAVESTLSQILEVNAPKKYYLSARACEGILRRAERRGKKLPEMLKIALQQMIDREKMHYDPNIPCVMDTAAYSFDSLASNSMKSKNPHSGCRKVNIAKTLDTSTPDPSKNQGGIAVVECVFNDTENNVLCMSTQQGGAEIMENICPTITAAAGMSGNNQPVICLNTQHLFENHRADARYRGPLKVCPTLAARLGTGGNNAPLIVEKAVAYNGANITSPINKTNPQPGDPCHTLNTDNRNYVVYCLQGNGIDRADTAGCNGKGWKENISYTLNTIDRPAVVFAVGNGQADNSKLSEIPGALNCMHDQQAILIIDRAYFKQGEKSTYIPQLNDKICPTLITQGPHAVNVRYIVRRLTPTECARLQGFPDKHGHPDIKESLTDEEYKFWSKVRKTYGEIIGKPAKEFTKEKTLSWYNKLHSDSAEYKMWGNGIALPNALYIMQGIVAEG